jgi:hypothetical protein
LIIQYTLMYVRTDVDDAATANGERRGSRSGYSVMLSGSGGEADAARRDVELRRREAGEEEKTALLRSGAGMRRTVGRGRLRTAGEGSGSDAEAWRDEANELKEAPAALGFDFRECVLSIVCPRWVSRP